VENFNYTYAGHTSSFKIYVPNEFFSTISSADFWLALMVVKGFETRNRNTSKIKRPVETKFPGRARVLSHLYLLLLGAIHLLQKTKNQLSHSYQNSRRLRSKLA